MADFLISRYKSRFDIVQKYASPLKAKGVEGNFFSTHYDQPELKECDDCDCYLIIVENVEKVKERADGFEIDNKAIEKIGGKGELGGYKHSISTLAVLKSRHSELSDQLSEEHKLRKSAERKVKSLQEQLDYINQEHFSDRWQKVRKRMFAGEPKTLESNRGNEEEGFDGMGETLRTDSVDTQQS